MQKVLLTFFIKFVFNSEKRTESLDSFFGNLNNLSQATFLLNSKEINKLKGGESNDIFNPEKSLTISSSNIISPQSSFGTSIGQQSKQKKEKSSPKSETYFEYKLYPISFEKVRRYSMYSHLQNDPRYYVHKNERSYRGYGHSRDLISHSSNLKDVYPYHPRYKAAVTDFKKSYLNNRRNMVSSSQSSSIESNLSQESYNKNEYGDKNKSDSTVFYSPHTQNIKNPIETIDYMHSGKDYLASNKECSKHSKIEHFNIFKPKKSSVSSVQDDDSSSSSSLYSSKTKSRDFNTQNTDLSSHNQNTKGSLIINSNTNHSKKHCSHDSRIDNLNITNKSNETFNLNFQPFYNAISSDYLDINDTNKTDPFEQQPSTSNISSDSLKNFHKNNHSQKHNYFDNHKKSNLFTKNIENYNILDLNRFNYTGIEKLIFANESSCYFQIKIRYLIKRKRKDKDAELSDTEVYNCLNTHFNENKIDIAFFFLIHNFLTHGFSLDLSYVEFKNDQYVFKKSYEKIKLTKNILLERLKEWKSENHKIIRVRKGLEKLFNIANEISNHFGSINNPFLQSYYKNLVEDVMYLWEIKENN